MAYNRNIKIEWHDETKESHKPALDETAIEIIYKHIFQGCTQGELITNIFMDDEDLDDEGNKGIAYYGWWSIQTVNENDKDAELCKAYQAGYSAAMDFCLEQDKQKSQEKKEIIRNIKKLLETHSDSCGFPTYPDLAGEIHLDCQQLVKSTTWLSHLIYQYFPNHCTIEVYQKDLGEAIDTYDLRYNKMKLPLLKEILNNLQLYMAAVAENDCFK